MNGLLIVDKPAGPTSHDVVDGVRGALGIQRIGHTGTLDPIATGVLPLVIGRATRLAQFFSSTSKQYLATVRLGRATDTFDITGTAQPSSSPRGPDTITRTELDAALDGFRGRYWQVPPPFSARKIDGTRAYALARRKQAVRPRAVAVTVHTLDLVSFEGERLTLRLRASAGFYVRSLAHDLGERLECGACLEHLRREESGGFRVDESTPLDVIEREGQEAARRIVPLDRLLQEIPQLVLTEEGARRAAHGNTISPEDLDAPSSDLSAGPGTARERRVRLVDRAGALVALADIDAEGVLHPRIVLV